jgi:hypothetical protein
VRHTFGYRRRLSILCPSLTCAVNGDGLAVWGFVCRSGVVFPLPGPVKGQGGKSCEDVVR